VSLSRTVEPKEVVRSAKRRITSTVCRGTAAATNRIEATGVSVGEPEPARAVICKAKRSRANFEAQRVTFAMTGGKNGRTHGEPVIGNKGTNHAGIMA